MTTTHPGGSARRAGLRSAHLLTVMVVVAVLPHVVVLVRALGTDWHPSGDQAMEVLRMHDVGTAHTPLLGPYSRFGWDHPGPLLFWLGAPALRLFGPVGVLVTVGLLNIAATVGVAAAARRLGGAVFALVVTAAAAVMIHTHGAVKLVDPWNPWVSVLPLLCFLLCVPVAVIHRSRWALVTAALTGSFVAQSHLGNVPVVAAASGAALVWWWTTRPESTRGVRAGALTVGALLVVLWSGPIIDQIFGDPGNLWSLAEFALDSPEKPPALSQSFGAAARELGFLPAWAGAPEGVWPVDPAPAWTLLVLPALLLAGAGATGGVGTGLGGGWRLRSSYERDHVALVLYVLVVYAAAVFAVTRTTGGLIPYVLRWTWPVAVLATVVALLPVVRATRHYELRLHRELTAAVAGLAVATGLWASTATVLDGIRRPVEPSPATDRSVGGLADAVRAAIPPGRYGLQWTDVRSFSAVSIGAGVDLVRHGYEIDFPVDHASRVGEFRATGRTDVPLLIIVGQTPAEFFVPPVGAELVAEWDHLSPAERATADELEASIRADADIEDSTLVAVDNPAARADLVEQGASVDDVNALHRLEGDREAYDVWLAPPGTHRPG